jgi:adenylate kinase family enzyme
MRLLIIGCEYAGKTTLARRISRWMIDSMGLPYVPHLSDAERRRQATCRARQRS